MRQRPRRGQRDPRGRQGQEQVRQRFLARALGAVKVQGLTTSQAPAVHLAPRVALHPPRGAPIVVLLQPGQAAHRHLQHHRHPLHRGDPPVLHGAGLRRGDEVRSGGVYPGVQRRLLPRGHLRRRPDPDRDTLPVPQRRRLRLGAVLVHRTERRLGEVRLLRPRHLRQLRHRHARRVHHHQRDRRRGRTRGGASHIHHAEHARRRVLHPQGHHPLDVDLALLDLIPPVDVVRHHAQRVRGRGVHRPLRRRRRRPQVIPRHHAFVPAADQGRRVVRVQQAPRRLRGGPRRLGAREFRARRARQVEMPRVRGVFHPGAHRAVLLRRPVRATREALISLSSE